MLGIRDHGVAIDIVVRRLQQRTHICKHGMVNLNCIRCRREVGNRGLTKIGGKDEIVGDHAGGKSHGFSGAAVVAGSAGAVAGMLTLNGAHTALSAALQLTPSKARTSSAFESVPVTNVTSLNCAAVTSSSV